MACSVQLNHGDCDNANPIHIKTTMGNNIPQIPDIFVILIFFDLKFSSIHVISCFVFIYIFLLNIV